MRGFRRLAGALLLASACSATAPSDPDQVSSTTTTTTVAPSQRITVDSLAPPPGSEVAIGSCGFNTPSTCTTSWKGTFTVVYGANVQQPAFRVSFLDAGGRECLNEAPLDSRPLVANQPKTYTVSLLLFVTANPLNGAYVCGNPVNTASIRLQLFDRTLNGPLLMETTVSAPYRWKP